MELELDLVIDTPNFSVDMKSGLTTMQGVSDAVRLIAETVATDEVPSKNTSRSSVRTRLKKNFSGSYGQMFSVEAFEDEAIKRLSSVGKDNLAEIIEYYFSEAFYQNYPPLSSKAKSIINSLGDQSTVLIKALRKKTLIDNIHNVPNNFGYDVKIRYRQKESETRELQTFTEETYEKMSAKESNKIIELEVLITRFNTFTGNGRLQIKGKRETIAFGIQAYKVMSLTSKKLFSKNLDDNNGITENEDMKYLKIKATSLQKKDGDVVKYLVREASFVENLIREKTVE